MEWGTYSMTTFSNRAFISCSITRTCWGATSVDKTPMNPNCIWYPFYIAYRTQWDVFGRSFHAVKNSTMGTSLSRLVSGFVCICAVRTTSWSSEPAGSACADRYTQWDIFGRSCHAVKNSTRGTSLSRLVSGFLCICAVRNDILKRWTGRKRLSWPPRYPPQRGRASRCHYVSRWTLGYALAGDHCALKHTRWQGWQTGPLRTSKSFSVTACQAGRTLQQADTQAHVTVMRWCLSSSTPILVGYGGLHSHWLATAVHWFVF